MSQCQRADTVQCFCTAVFMFYLPLKIHTSALETNIIQKVDMIGKKLNTDQ